MKRMMLLLGLLASVACAQDQRQVQVNVGGPGGPGMQAPPDQKVTSEQAKRGRQWMQTAEAQAKGLQGGMRAYALLQVARTYAPADKPHAVELLEDALAATRGMDDDSNHMRAQLQRDIVQAIVPLAPERADELLAQLDPAGRQSVLKALLDYYRQKKLERRAVETIYRIAAEDEFPYDAGLQMMRSMPTAQRGEMQQMFNTALESYRNHKHPGLTIGGGDFAQLIVELQPKLSPDVVKDAVFEVLRQAEAPSDNGPQQISLASERGSVAMGSIYDYRLFQLLPALRAADADEAERLLKKNREVAGMLDKYPRGAEQLMGQQDGRGGGMVSVGGGGGRGAAGGMDRVEAQRSQKLVADAATDPDTALANVSTLTSSRMKVAALNGIAHQAWKTRPGVAKSALKQLGELLPQLANPGERVLPAAGAAKLYLKMGEPEDARKVIEKALETAAELYKQDTDADDPNQALKAYWPSASAYTQLLRVAAQISPDWALEELKSVPDDEIATVARIGMASAILGKPSGEITMLSEKKNGQTSMMMTTTE